MSAELREAVERKELYREYFTPLEWNKIERIMKDPHAAEKWMALSMLARRVKQICRKALRKK